MAISSIGYDGSVQEGGWAKLSKFLGREYAVDGQNSFTLEIVQGSDRTVRLAPGSAYGRGVLDESDAYENLQLNSLTTGTRWDTIVLRRNWQSPDPGGSSSLVALPGTQAKAVASAGAGLANLQTQPGVMDDQILYVVQVTAGQQLPTAVWDLRNLWNPGARFVDSVADVTQSERRLGQPLYEMSTKRVRVWDGTSYIDYVTKVSGDFTATESLRAKNAVLDATVFAKDVAATGGITAAGIAAINGAFTALVVNGFNVMSLLGAGGLRMNNGNGDANLWLGLSFNATPDGILIGNGNLFGTYGTVISVKAGGAGAQFFVGWGGAFGVRTWHSAANGLWDNWRSI